jgi:hypothetical protein
MSGLFMCRIASLFLLQWLKGSMSGDARDFNNDTPGVIKFFLSGLQKLEQRAEKCIELRGEDVE